MIKRIFFDLDETLIHTVLDEHPCQECVVHDDGDGLGPVYFTIVNPQAKEMLEYASSLVGHKNVFILTASGKDYAHRVNKLADFGILSENIFTHNDLEQHKWGGAYGHVNTVPHSEIADRNNVLIDNLPPRENESKCSFIGIRGSSDHYIEVRDFYGVLFSSYSYKDIVCEAIKNLYHSTI